jgi:23S rRNA (pseudouridine1915-N3)-methyltransferase
MRVIVAAVGRERTGPLRALADGYRARCPWPVEIVEVVARGAGALEQRLAEEGERLLRAVPGGAAIVALDERGDLLDSEAFAARIAGWRDAGRSDLAFLIGGADGLAPPVLERANLRLAFGRMTWPHQLVRVMLLEQLYRASSILAGHPYHRA